MPCAARRTSCAASKLPIEFCGFVEGDDIAEGTVDVIVTDGFTGNVALKTAEGTAKLVVHFLRTALRRVRCSAGSARYIASGALKTLRRKLDPRASNGGIFLGLNGVVVKSHGGTDALGFASALDMAIDMAKAEVIPKIVADRAAIVPLQTQASGSCRFVTVIRSQIIGCGAYLPETVLTNAELAKRVDTSDEWIVERTGIRERRIAEPRREDIRSRGQGGAKPRSPTRRSSPSELDLIIVATTTPDETFPSVATRVQARLGMTRGAGFDVQAVCSGFVYRRRRRRQFHQGRCRRKPFSSSAPKRCRV